MIIPGVYDYEISCCSSSRATAEGKTLLQLLLKTGW